MKPSEVLTHPKLRKFVRTVASGTYLFRQGESGASMFIVLEGFVELVAERDGESHVAGLLEPGEFLGEKAFISRTPHARHYSARAKGDATLLEISNPQLEFMKVAAPELMMNLMLKAFEVAVRRLENVNYLVQALRPSDNQRRLIGCILYFCRTLGKEVPQGIEVILSPRSLSYHIDMNPADIGRSLQALIGRGLLQAIEGDRFLIADLGRLESHWRELFKAAA